MKKKNLIATFLLLVIVAQPAAAQYTIPDSNGKSSLLTRWGIVISLSGKEIRSTLELEKVGESYKGAIKATTGATAYSTSLGESPLKNIVVKTDNSFTADITFNLIPFGETAKKIEGAITGKLVAEKLIGELNLPGFGKTLYWGGKSRKGCANADVIASICGSVGEVEVNEEGEYGFEYPIELRKASCVDEFDSEEVANLKIQNMFRELDDKLVCISNHLAIKPGGLLKLAVAAYFGDFIANSINKWKINVNKIDAADNATVLDFIEDQLLINAREPSLVSKLKSYKERILKAGGRYNKYKELNK